MFMKPLDYWTTWYAQGEPIGRKATAVHLFGIMYADELKRLKPPLQPAHRHRDDPLGCRTNCWWDGGRGPSDPGFARAGVKPWAKLARQLGVNRHTIWRWMPGAATCDVIDGEPVGEGGASLSGMPP